MSPFFLLATLAVVDADAAQLDRLADIADLSVTSEAVVRGVVTRAETVEGRRGFVTHYTMEVEQLLGGKQIDVVQFTMPGGQLNGLVQTVSGVPQLATGDEAVVFVPVQGPVRMRGVLEVDGDELIDALERNQFPTTVAQLTDDLHALRTRAF